MPNRSLHLLTNFPVHVKKKTFCHRKKMLILVWLGIKINETDR